MKNNGVNENDSRFQEKKNIQEMVQYHYHIAIRQKNFYNKLRTDTEALGEDTILIDIDYKQKIYYGKNSPFQLTSEFYKYGSCSLLGFGLYYVDKIFNTVTKKEEKYINAWNFDLLSDDTSQKAADFIKGFRFLRKNSTFKSIEKKNYIIFTDTSKNFRCQEVCQYYLRELANEGIRVSFNYFGEYHGKVINIYKILFYTINLEIIFFSL